MFHLTPHISGSSAGHEFLRRVWELFVENLARFQVGWPLPNALSAVGLTRVGAD